MRFIQILTIFLLTALFVSLKGQRYEAGLQVGASNLVGDVGRTNYIYPFPSSDISTYGVPLNINMLFKLNFNPYQSLRFNLGYNHIYFSDRYATENYRRVRRDSFGNYFGGTNDIVEGQVLFEYNFLPINNEQKNGMYSPYIFAGLGAMLYKQPNLTVNNTFYRRYDPSTGNEIPVSPDDPSVQITSYLYPQKYFKTTYEEGTKRGMTLSIPFGGGIKYKFNYNWTIFAEVMFRPTFADDIDYSKLNSKNVKINYEPGFVPSGSNKKSILQTAPYDAIAQERADKLRQERTIGNTKSNDWVNTISIGLTYSFGRPPCYCD